MLLVLILSLSSLAVFSAFRQGSFVRVGNSLKASIIDHSITEKITHIIQSNKVVLFMKGEKDRPQCGFSDNACRILRAVKTPFETINVLTDQAMREAIKQFSMWPTIPQLYVRGNFVGGSDIMLEMYKSGELAKLIDDDSGATIVNSDGESQPM